MDQSPQEQAATIPSDTSRYTIRLDEFEGPLDLLLHLIKKNELDIHNVPIALITEQYLSYIDMMKTLNLEVAGEYLVMAATLAHIKSKSLLPEDSVQDQELEEEEDPKEALVRRLLEYQKFKDAGEYFGSREWLGRDVFTRHEKLPPQTSSELHPVSLFKLVELFHAKLKSLPKILEHEIVLERISVAERIRQVIDDLSGRERESMEFMELLGQVHTRHELIVTFLALLEMVRVSLVRVAQPDLFSPIVITKTANLTENTAPMIGEESYGEGT